MLQPVAVPNKQLNDSASLVGRALADEIRERAERLAGKRVLHLSAIDAREMSEGWDVCLVHDPRPAALPSLVPGNSGRWVWRCPIDLSTPSPDTVSRMLPYLDPYSAAVFHTRECVPADIDGRAHIIPPAIDPLAPKNMAFSPEDAVYICEQFGIDVDEHLEV